MTRNIKLTIEYDGTQFSGWQTQTTRKDTRHCEKTLLDKRTVQGELEKALHIIFKAHIKTIGSGRTDCGVHAIGQVANFKTRSSMSLQEIQNALNANLPQDISIINVEEVDDGFHAQYSPKSKTYRYTILNRKVRSAQQRHFCLLFPQKLNLTRMRQESKTLVGRHDFKSFQASDPAKKRAGKKEDTIRTMKELKISKKGDFIYINFTANGFLYKMVRNIVGTLLEIGTGKLPKGSMRKILSQKDRTTAGQTAKSLGLCLVNVQY